VESGESIAQVSDLLVRVTTPRQMFPRPPLVLVVDDQEWATRSLETVLKPSGFSILRAFTGARALQQARATPPDVVFVAKALPDIDGLTLCRVLRDELLLGQRVPLLVTLHDRPTREERLDALRAGAWDVLAPLIDAEELILRLQAYVRAKFDADRIREAGLLDAPTGLYSPRGLERRAAEFGSWARRWGEALSCVVLAVSQPDADKEDASVAAGDEMAEVFRKTARASDAIGRVGQAELAVFAPRTDAQQAVQMAERFGAALRASGMLGREQGRQTLHLWGGYDSVNDARETPVQGPELLTRATVALAQAKEGREAQWLRAFHTQTTSSSGS
jgi:PleD family two-component response regulator